MDQSLTHLRQLTIYPAWRLADSQLQSILCLRCRWRHVEAHKLHNSVHV